MEQVKIVSAFISPVDREKMEAIIKATCEYYGITEQILTQSTKKSADTAVRRQCYYLIKQNTDISITEIAERLHTTISPISRGNGIIDVHKTIYASTSQSLKGIASIANSFDKKHEWHIQ